MSGDCLLELSALATPQTMRKKMQSRDPRSEDNKDKTRERKMCVSGWRGCKQEGGERRRQGGSIARAHARTDYHKMNFTRVHELCTSCEMVSSEKRDWGEQTTGGVGLEGGVEVKEKPSRVSFIYW